MLAWFLGELLGPLIVVGLAAFLGPRILELYRSKRELTLRDSEYLREAVSKLLYDTIAYNSKLVTSEVSEFIVLESQIRWQLEEISAISNHIVGPLLKGDRLELDLHINKLAEASTGGTFQQRDVPSQDGTRTDRDERIGLAIIAANDFRKYILDRRSDVMRTTFF
jgi:hypothetical protein